MFGFAIFGTYLQTSHLFSWAISNSMIWCRCRYQQRQQFFATFPKSKMAAILSLNPPPPRPHPLSPQPSRLYSKNPKFLHKKEMIKLCLQELVRIVPFRDTYVQPNSQSLTGGIKSTPAQGCRTCPPQATQAGGPVRQPYAGVDYIPQ